MKISRSSNTKAATSRATHTPPIRVRGTLAGALGWVDSPPGLVAGGSGAGGSGVFCVAVIKAATFRTDVWGRSGAGWHCTNACACDAGSALPCRRRGPGLLCRRFIRGKRPVRRSNPCRREIGVDRRAGQRDGRDGPARTGAWSYARRWLRRPPDTRRMRRKRTTAPAMAVIQVLRLKNVLRVCTWNTALAMNPPSSAPAMPTTVARRKPVLRPVRCSAMNPATAPSTIQAMMPMGFSLLIGVTPELSDHVHDQLPSLRGQPRRLVEEAVERVLSRRAASSRRVSLPALLAG